MLALASMNSHFQTGLKNVLDRATFAAACNLTFVLHYADTGGQNVVAEKGMDLNSFRISRESQKFGAAFCSSSTNLRWKANNAF